jgi:hypothetical protein
MIQVQPVRLQLADLIEIIHVLGEIGTKPAMTTEVLELIGLAGQEEQAVLANASSRWQSAIKVALEYEGTYLRRLLDGAYDKLSPGPRRQLNEARQCAATAFVNRVLHIGHPELDDQVGQLHSARTYEQMRPAAENLRGIGLDARRMLMDPQLGNELALQLGTIDPERRRFELADLAIDVVTAADYLLHLVDERSSSSQQKFSAERDLGTNAPSNPDLSGNNADGDLRYRRVLDSRAAAVRLGGRLLRVLRSETVTPL